MAKYRPTPAQRKLLEQIERYGVVRCELWQSRRRRCLARLQAAGIIRYSQMRHGWVTTSEYDREMDTVGQAVRAIS
jgi:hypothetical protein